MVDGDGLAHASRAIYQRFLSGMDPTLPLEAALLRCIYLPLDAAGLKHHTLSGFLTVSHLAAVGIFWLLAQRIYPLGGGKKNFTSPPLGVFSGKESGFWNTVK